MAKTQETLILKLANPNSHWHRPWEHGE